MRQLTNEQLIFILDSQNTIKSHHETDPFEYVDFKEKEITDLEAFSQEIARRSEVYHRLSTTLDLLRIDDVDLATSPGVSASLVLLGYLKEDHGRFVGHRQQLIYGVFKQLRNKVEKAFEMTREIFKQIAGSNQSENDQDNLNQSKTNRSDKPSYFDNLTDIFLLRDKIEYEYTTIFQSIMEIQEKLICEKVGKKYTQSTQKNYQEATSIRLRRKKKRKKKKKSKTNQKEDQKSLGKL